jgi:hypothetical protein
MWYYLTQEITFLTGSLERKKGTIVSLDERVPNNWVFFFPIKDNTYINQTCILNGPLPISSLKN